MVHVCADYLVLQKGCQASWSGGRRHSPPEFVRFRLVRTLIHTRQIALCEPKSQTISNMRRSSMLVTGMLACREAWPAGIFLR